MFLVATTLCAAPCLRGWCNGESIYVYHDPRSGLIYPLRKSAAEVQQQRLTLRLDPPDAVVETEYTLYNPLTRPEKLHIAFAIPGDAPMREHPVWFDGKPIRWRYQTSAEVLDESLPAMRAAFEQWLRKHPAVYRALENAYRGEGAYMPSGISAAELRPVFRKAGLRIQPPEQLYAAYRAWRTQSPISGSLLANTLLALGVRSAVPSERWNAAAYHLHPRTGRLLHASLFREPTDEDTPSSAPPVADSVSLLRFDIELQPQRVHRLRVRYHQTLGRAYWSLHGESVLEGYHLMYLLRTQSWARYGPIRVEVSIPDFMRLRAFPVMRFDAVRNGRRIYRAELRNPQGNLYVVADEPDTFRYYPLYTTRNEPLENIDAALHEGRFYIPLAQMLRAGALHRLRLQPDVNGDIRIEVGASELRLNIHRAKAWLDGKEYPLLEKPRRLYNAWHLTAQDALFLMLKAGALGDANALSLASARAARDIQLSMDRTFGRLRLSARSAQQVGGAR